MTPFRGFIDARPFLEDGDVFTAVPLSRCHRLDFTMTVFLVVPANEVRHPVPRFLQSAEGVRKQPRGKSQATVLGDNRLR